MQGEREKSMIRLENITPENWREPLQVKEEQKGFVSEPYRLLARAYAYREENSRAFLVMAEDKPVGMGLYHDCAELDAYDFSQMLIDKRYQGRGYGREAVRLVLEEMCREAQFDKVVLCYIEGNEAARRLYESFGFAETGRDEDEIIMEARL